MTSPRDLGGISPNIGPNGTSCWAELDTAGARVRLRAHQSLKILRSNGDALFCVKSGILMFRAVLPGKHRQGICLLYPGDILPTWLLPLLEDIDLVGFLPSELLRIRRTAADDLMAGSNALRALVDDRAAQISARLSMHIVIVGTLTGPERLASLLVELGLKTGRHAGGSVVIDISMNRKDIAEHLAMNGDTVSRIMSRLRATDVIAGAGRNRIVVRNWNALCSLSPIASILADQRTDVR